MLHREFNRDSTADDVLEGVDLTARTAIITGASGGLGAETARALVSKGCAVTITARNISKGQGVVDSVLREFPDAEIDVGELELSVPDSINAFSEEWLAKHGQLDMLILNAGIMACPLSRTQQGWEMQLATNHFGHFLLTQQLMPALTKAGQDRGARVIALSSAGHVMSGVLFDDLHFENNEYNPWIAYGQSKSANALFALELDKRVSEQNIRAFSVHPGMIHTDLARHLDEKTITDMLERMASAPKMQAKTIPCGAATSVWAATAPELNDAGGIYLADCAIAPSATEQDGGYEAHISDHDAASHLWQVTEDALGVKFC